MSTFAFFSQDMIRNKETADFMEEVHRMWATDVQPAIDHLLQNINNYILNPEETEWAIPNPMDVYTSCYRLTTKCKFNYDHLELMYNKQMDTIREFCSLFQVRSLREMVFQYEGFRWMIKWMRCFFHHLNRMMIRSTSLSKNADEETMLWVIRDHYLSPQQDAIFSLLSWHWKDIREKNYYKDYQLMRAMDVISEIYPAMSMSVASHFMWETEVYYRKLRSMPFECEPYMKMCANLARRENEMILLYMTSQVCTYHLFLEILIKPVFSEILHHPRYGWETVLRSGNIQDIKTAHDFLQFGDEPEWLSSHHHFIKTTMEEKDGNMPLLLEFFMSQNQLYHEVIPNARMRKEMDNVLQKCFVDFFRTGTKHTIQLVRMADMMIRKKNTKAEELISVVAMMLFCPDRDYMHSLYKDYLRRRLLEHCFLEKEELMVSLMRKKLGVAFVLNFQVMVDEMRNRKLQYGCISMHILSRVAWGLSLPSKQLLWQSPIQNHLSYMVPYVEGQRHDLSMTHGSVVLERKAHEFLMSPVQAIVLLAMQEMGEEGVNQSEIVAKLGIRDDPDHNVRGVLDSLSKDRCALLLFEEKEKKWKINPGFHSKSRRLLLPPVAEYKVDEETGEDHRQHAIMLEALIVRIVKHHSPLSYVHLVQRIGKEMTTSVQQIRNSVESLIGRDYLSKEISMIHYVP